MIARLFAAFLYLTATSVVVLAQFSGSIGTPGVSSPNLVFTATCSQSTTFIARTASLTANQKYAYDGLICGLVTDGVWSLLDVLYVYATVNQTTALLNLPNATYAGSNASSLTFTANRGFTGSGTSGQYIGTGFNASTAISPQFAANSAHMSAWNLTNVAADMTIIGASTYSATFALHPKYIDNNGYYRLNDASALVTSVSDPRGFLLANRSSSTGRQAYQNAVSIITYGSEAQTGYPNANEVVVAGTSFASTNAWQVPMMSLGASLSAGQVTSFYNRLRTYMTAVGVP